MRLRMQSGSFRLGNWVFFAAVPALALLPATSTAQTQAVTFTKDVAPILQRSCVTCHRPGEMAPMSLMTYEDARPWAKSMKTRVSAREMPPFHIDRTIDKSGPWL